ncbi:MAG: NAD(P)-dependent oxidoreductase [Acidimicrobiia bacterium]|nr:NAD(P)-dependent oxidoreductase [Acidimicrobiia bacterium]
MKRRVAITGGSGFIGTNLVAHFVATGDDVLNLDIAPPRDPEHHAWWRRCDLLEPAGLTDHLGGFDPTHLLHFAARTDLGGTSPVDYAVNTTGTDNVIAAGRVCPALQRIVFASSLLVCRNGYRPRADTDYCPTTAYGTSKQYMEQSIRRSTQMPPWTIVRPTSIWGPWFGVPYRDFFDVVLARRYVHPGRARVTKAIGFVGNTVSQIEALLGADPGVVDNATFYLADWPERSIDEWASSIAAQAGIRPPRRVPVALLRVAALVGDVLQRTGLMAEPPLTSFRLDNLRTSSSYELDRLVELTGPLPFSLEEGVGATLEWLELD